MKSPNPRSMTLSSCSAIAEAHGHAADELGLRAVFGLTMRPTANTPSTRETRTSPRVGVDADLDELRAERVPGELGLRP